jgi:hypothetical protein
MANLCTRKKGVATVQEKTVELTANKRLGLFESDRGMTFLVELSDTLNTLDTFVVLLLRCHRNLVLQMMLGAIGSVIDARETLKMQLKTK